VNFAGMVTVLDHSLRCVVLCGAVNFTTRILRSGEKTVELIQDQFGERRKMCSFCGWILPYAKNRDTPRKHEKKDKEKNKKRRG